MLALPSWRLRLLFFVLLVLSCGHAAASLRVGVATVDITPEIRADRPVWLAGQQRNRQATGVHDALEARALVLDDGERRVALVSVDCIGLQYPQVEAVRAELPDFAYVLVASTHTHEGPDVVGLWGPTPTESGVDSKYLEELPLKIVQAVRAAVSSLVAARAEYGTASRVELLKDFRLPEVYDPVLRVVRFVQVERDTPCALLVQWTSHPVEPDGNTLVTRDWMGVTVDTLERTVGCPVIYFSGAVGGLMGTAVECFRDAEGNLPVETPMEFIQLYGEAVAELAQQALEGGAPIELTPILFAAQPVAAPLDNPGYRQARQLGVLRRAAYQPGKSGEAFGPEIPAAQLDGEQVTKTEVAYLRLGSLHVAAIPGELYPELVYGEFPAAAETGVDYPDADLEPHVMAILPDEPALILGLANDAVGYIIPRRQWDVEPPFAYDRERAQYGEVNSLGPNTAAVLMESLRRRVEDVTNRTPTATP